MKCGSVVFIGEPNVGKSSLVNKLVGESVSIVTDMAGTTREGVRGYLFGDGFQIAFLDTPGMARARNALDKHMNKHISRAVAEADVICYVLDACDITLEYIQKISNLKGKKPMIVVVNKIDRSGFEQLYPKLELLNPLGLDVVCVSCKTGKSLDILVQEIVKLLPSGNGIAGEGGEIVDEDEYTDQPMKKIAAEIIRGELIKVLKREIPFGVAVDITGWRERAREVDIEAEIICEKQSHRPIIISKLKGVGISARARIEKVTGKHIRLQTHVLVREKWREKFVPSKD